MKNGLHVRLNPWNSDQNCRFPIENSDYRLAFWITDQKSRIPIGILDFRSDFQKADRQSEIFDRKTAIPIGIPGV